MISPNAALADFKRQLLSPIGTALEFNDVSKRQAASTSKGLMKGVKQRRSLLSTISDADTGLSRATIDSAIMTHNTTVEFLHYFWDVFLSGDEGRVSELAKLVETLHKSLERIEAVATEANAERQQKQEDLRRKEQEFLKRTGKRMRVNTDSIGGGGEALHNLLKSTEMAVKFAEAEYQRKYKEQVAQNGAQA
jgi:transcription initiation factor TFIIH subunit 1